MTEKWGYLKSLSAKKLHLITEDGKLACKPNAENQEITIFQGKAPRTLEPCVFCEKIEKSRLMTE